MTRGLGDTETRRYPAAFRSKLNDAEGEAEETRVWIELALRCRYLQQAEADELDGAYDAILSQLVRMIQTADKWAVG